MSIDDVMARIAKIQRLAERGGTPHEAAAAAAKVQELLAQHSLTLAQVAIAGGEPLSGYGHRQHSTGHSMWRRSLMSVLARSNMCLALYLIGGETIDVFGHRDNVRVVIDLYIWLAAEIDRMAEVAWSREGSGAVRAWKNRYREGAVQTIAERLTEEPKARQATVAPTNTALVVIQDKVNAVVDKVYPGIKRHNIHHSVPSGGGYDAGARDAAGMTVARSARIGAGPARIASGT